jgi:DNA-binding MarR family transcriptional regulator
MPNPTPRSFELQILDLFRIHLFGSRMSTKIDASDLSANQLFVLGELVRRDSPSLNELCTVLKMHQSTCSRIMTHLERVGMIQSTRDSGDGRRMVAVATDRGAMIAKMSRLTQQAIIEERLREFSSLERGTFESFMRVFLGEDAYHRIRPIPGEPEMAIISWGLTYDHGVVSDNFLETGYSIMDWVMLSEIYYQQRAPHEFARLLNTRPSTISLRIKALVGRGLLKTTRGVTDKRELILSLSKRGDEALHAIEAGAERYFGKTLRTLPRPQIEAGVELFRRYVYGLECVKTLSMTLTRVAKGELDALRRVLVRALPTYLDQYPLGPQLLDPSNRVFRLEDGERSTLILECAVNKKGVAQLVNILLAKGEFPVISVEAIRETLEPALGVPLRVSSPLTDFIHGHARALHRGAATASE